MVTKQGDIIDLKNNFHKEIKVNQEIYYRLTNQFKTSILQASLDYPDKAEDDLKVIVIDKLLRLNFPENYTAFFDKDNNEILTDDEQRYLEDPEILGKKDLILIKNNLVVKNYSIELKFKTKKYILLINNLTKKDLILGFIKWCLEN